MPGETRAHLRYLSYVLRHKWFVLVAGLRTGAPLWRLLIHDWSKFTPAEWGPYVRNFYGPPPACRCPWKGEGGHGSDCPVIAYEWAAPFRALAFDRAWLHHQHASPHHWQHWILREDSGDTRALEMPAPLVREMVADWMGAGRAITGRWEVAEWYAKNAGKMVLHPLTRALVQRTIRNATRSTVPTNNTEG